MLVREAGGKVQAGVAQQLCEQAYNNKVSVFELLHSVKVDIYCRVNDLLAPFVHLAGLPIVFPQAHVPV